SQVTNNENAALGLGIVNSGINTIGTPGFVTVDTGINSPVNIDITYPPLRPSLGAGIVSVPVFDYSPARWPFLPPGFVPPSDTPAGARPPVQIPAPARRRLRRPEPRRQLVSG